MINFKLKHFEKYFNFFYFQNVTAMLKVPKEMLVTKKEDVLAVVTSKEINVMNVIQNTTGSQLVTLVCVTSMVPWMIYAMPQQANVLARTVLQMINAANALKVSLDIQIVKVNPRTFILFFSFIQSYSLMIKISTFYTSFTNNQLQHISPVEISEL